MGTQSHRKHHDYAPAQHHLEYPSSTEHGQQGWLDATEQRARILVLTPAMCRDRERERATRPGKAQLHSSSRQLPERAQRLSRTGSPGSRLGRTELIAWATASRASPPVSICAKGPAAVLPSTQELPPSACQAWGTEDLAEPTSQGWPSSL